MLRFSFFSTNFSCFEWDNYNGDVMKKYIMPILVALVTGLILGRFVLNQYEFEGKIVPVGSNGKNAYFIQQGVYSSKESMEENVTDFPYYIYSIIDDKYYVYIGITFLEENLDKIKGYYEKMGYITYVKELSVDNQNFITVLEQYDSLLQGSSEEEIIGTVCSQVLSNYEELVLKYDNQN